MLLKRTEPADAEASVERSEKTLNWKDSKDSKDSKEEDARDVFGSAADAILAAADAALSSRVPPLLYLEDITPQLRISHLCWQTTLAITVKHTRQWTLQRQRDRQRHES